MRLYPLKLKPIFKQRIWGGCRLREFFNKNLPFNEKIGESWELTDLPNDKSMIANGKLEGQTFGSLVKKHPKEVIGNESYKEPFPLLIKFIDAEEILSVQVHPDSGACARLGSGNPKSECWYIVNAKPDAFIYKGLKAGITKEIFTEALKSGNIADSLEKIPVAPGQCHFLPAGTVHSIGSGIILVEIQNPSDTTYRVFDWNRTDKNGKTRQLHIEQAIECINFATTVDLPITTVGRLLDCEYFKLDKGHQLKNCEQLLSPDKLKVIVFLTGNGRIAAADESCTRFKAGDTIVIPASYEGVIIFEDDVEYLTITI